MSEGGTLLVGIVALSVVAMIVLVAGQFFVIRRAAARCAPESDAGATSWALRAIAQAGSADALVKAALTEVDAAIVKARRSGSGTSTMLDLRLTGVVKVRKAFERSDDEPQDVLRALALAREATRLASQTAAHGEAFNEWLRTNGHRFMG